MDLPGETVLPLPPAPTLLISKKPDRSSPTSQQQLDKERRGECRERWLLDREKVGIIKRQLGILLKTASVSAGRLYSQNSEKDRGERKWTERSSLSEIVNKAGMKSET